MWLLNCLDNDVESSTYVCIHVLTIWKRFKKLCPFVFPHVLDVVWSIICNSIDIVEDLLCDINNDLECWELDLRSSRVALGSSRMALILEICVRMFLMCKFNSFFVFNFSNYNNLVVWEKKIWNEMALFIYTTPQDTKSWVFFVPLDFVALGCPSKTLIWT